MNDRHVSPKVHRDPPTGPQPWLDPDPLTVEPECTDQRVPYFGWEAARDRWARAGERPISAGCAWFGLLACIALAAVVILLLAAPRSAAVIPPVGTSEDAEAPAASRAEATPGGSGQQPTGAPLPAPEPRAVRPVPAPLEAQPTGAVGTALIGGYAAWFDVGPGLYGAAGPLLREALGDNWRGQLVEVESGDRSVTVMLTDWCFCGIRQGQPTLIDLSRDAFAELADPALGVIRVSIEIDPPRHPDDDRMRVEDGGPTLPPTDAEGAIR